MKRPLMILMLALLAVSLWAAYAFEPTTPEENDPRINPDANACFASGSMEYKCGTSELFWNAGWYLIRFERGIITRDQVPDQYKWVLPKENEPSTEGPELLPTLTKMPL